MADWVERIPGAMEKAENILAETCSCSRAECRTDRGGLTEIEIGLAEALWAMLLRDHDPRVIEKWSDVVLEIELEIAPGGSLDALRAFVEKVEAL